MATPILRSQENGDEGARFWELTAQRFGFTDFLSPEDGFRTCIGAHRPWANRSKPRIYFWLAENGEAYVGQSIQPRARLRQHMKVHGDLVRAAFLCCPRGELDHLKAKLVRDIGEHFRLRNIKLALSIASEVPFDMLVSAEERAEFLAGATLPEGDWRSLDHLHQLQARKFAQFCVHPRSGAALGALRVYVTRALPKPATTEVGFWSVTIRPKDCFIRVNAGQQEVFTHELHEGAPSVRVMTDQRISVLRSWRMRYQVTSFENRLEPRELERWLTGWTIVSCRRLVLQLMRHTQALNSGSHCPQAVRANPPSKKPRPSR